MFSKRRFLIPAALLAFLMPMNALAGDFVDTRVTLLFSDDNVFADAGETTPNSPSARFGAGNSSNSLFYDAYNSQYSGFESLTNLVLYKQAPAFFKGLTTEAALALNLLVAREKSTSSLDAVKISDASSYLRLNYTPESWDASKGEGISFTGFPLSADRMRLGFAPKVTWGGSRVFPNNGESVPGAKLQLTKRINDEQLFYVWAGIKTTLILNDKIHEQETNYGVLLGGGVDITSWLRLDLNGGYFQKGVNPQTSVLGRDVDAYGVSGQLVFHYGEPVGNSVDFNLYKNDPDLPSKFFRAERYPGGFSFTGSIEGSFLAQELADPDVYAQTSIQKAYAGVLQLRAKYDYWRFGIVGLMRSLSFIQFNVPGYPPFVDFPEGSDVSGEKFIAFNVDYYFPTTRLTPGISAGIQMPASYSTSGTLGGNNPSAALQGKRTVVVKDSSSMTVLPSGEEAKLVTSAKVNLRWDISEFFSAIGELYLTYDRNKTTFKDSSEGVAEAVFEDAWGLGFNLMMQARF